MLPSYIRPLAPLLGGALVAIAFAQAPQQQPATPAANNMFPQWAWDGRQIAFTSDRDGDSEICIMSADGSKQRRLTRAPGNDAFPNFSRDGKLIAFTSTRDGDPRST